MAKDEARSQKIKEHVKKRYGDLASRGGSCCCGGDVADYAKAIGYSDHDIKKLPAEAVSFGLGCGNPAALAGLKKGQVVLDLGSGGGVDVFLASAKVGERGRVIGVDMTPEMLKRARATAKKHGYTNVEFRKGEIENLPVEDDSVNVVLSNCVVNLSPDKPAVYREAYRVLKPGGRMLISDLVTEGKLPEDVRTSFDAWAGCVAGALERSEYLRVIREAGFSSVKVVRERAFSECGMDKRLQGKIVSVQVEATKPRSRRV